jgi:hypothetical protein
MTPDPISRFRTACAIALVAGVCVQAQETGGVRDRNGLHDGFFQSQGAHFTVLFEGPQDYALAGRALEVLEEAYFRIGTALYTFPDRPITVILYTQQQFRDVTRAPEWAAGAYDGRIRIPIRGALDKPEELERVLSHELTHAMIQAIAPRGVPTWLNEGLAVNFEPRGTAWADTELAATSERRSLQELTGTFAGKSADEARLAYAQSAVIARRLLEEGGGSAVVAILEDLASGLTFRAAVEQRLFIPYDVFAGPDISSR